MVQLWMDVLHLLEIGGAKNKIYRGPHGVVHPWMAVLRPPEMGGAKNKIQGVTTW